jgi:hypothetical protein
MGQSILSRFQDLSANWDRMLCPNYCGLLSARGQPPEVAGFAGADFAVEDELLALSGAASSSIMLMRGSESSFTATRFLEELEPAAGSELDALCP